MFDIVASADPLPDPFNVSRQISKSFINFLLAESMDKITFGYRLKHVPFKNGSFLDRCHEKCHWRNVFHFISART